MYSYTAAYFIRNFNTLSVPLLAFFAALGIAALINRKWRLKLFGGSVFWAFCAAALAAFTLEATAFNFQHYLKYFAGPEIYTANVSKENPRLFMTSEAGYSAEIIDARENDGRKAFGILFKGLNRKVTSIFAQVEFTAGEVGEMQIQWTSERNTVRHTTKKLYRYMPHKNYVPVWPRGNVSELVVIFKNVVNTQINVSQIVLNRQIPFYFSGLRLMALSLLFFTILAICVRKLRAKFSFLPVFWEKHKKFVEKSFVYASIGIVLMSFIVIVIMYVKCRSLWLDEAMLAESIVSRSWPELLVPPLSNNQSAPVLYVIFVKLIGQIFGYSEFSLRILSLLAWIGLLIGEKIFLKRVLGCKSNIQIAFIVAVTALLPAYIWYSNELKPYVSDAFFAILSLLLYFYYTRSKIKLPALTGFYILILGFSSPAIFFIGGILSSEFLTVVFTKERKKEILFLLISGIVVVAVFGLYYYWWMLPVVEPMKEYWGKANNIQEGIHNISRIFSPFVKGPRAGLGMGDATYSQFVWFFVPFALLGIFSFIKSKNRIAYSVVMSLFFAIFASAIGYWPVNGRLWLFLPAIVFVFTPAGLTYIHDKIKHENITRLLEVFVFSAIIIILSINCPRYTGDRTYIGSQEINPLINYVQKNIRNNEKLYVYVSAQPAFKYKNGYAKTKIGNVVNDNIIYGKNREEWRENSLGDELSSILENEKTYLIFSHHAYGINGGLATLQKYGKLTLVMNVHHTLLFYFERKTK